LKKKYFIHTGTIKTIIFMGCQHSIVAVPSVRRSSSLTTKETATKGDHGVSSPPDEISIETEAATNTLVEGSGAVQVVEDYGCTEEAIQSIAWCWEVQDGSNSVTPLY
jgi:hypothetical protein